MPQDSAVTEFISRNLPPVFLQIANGDVPPVISHICEMPTAFYELQGQAESEFTDVFPLIQCSVTRLFVFDSAKSAFLEWNLESDTKAVSRTYQGFIATLLANMILSGDTTEDVREAAVLFEYKYWDDFMDSYGLRGFVSDIDAKEISDTDAPFGESQDP